MIPKGGQSTRTELYQRFVAEFSSPAVTKVAAPQDISKIESELGTLLPESYVSFVQEHGAPFTPDILDLIVDSGFVPSSI
ncbi:MAG: SMI1/KNR4 family protein [Planctomycetales bacterium]